MATHTLNVENVIQGVSQQAPQSRRLTQAEEQFDCLNQPVEGCVARPGFNVRKRLFATPGEGMFIGSIVRDEDELYEVFITNGSLRVFNMLSGVEASVSGASSSYLSCSGVPKNVFGMAAAEDVIFVVNKERIPQMKPDISPPRPNEAMLFQRAGNYKNTYTVSITLGTTVHQWQYETPDNTVPGNAALITTDAIAFALFNAMTTDATNSISSLGFNAHRIGSLIRIWRNDTTEFQLDVQDGQGNTQLLGYKETVGSFEKLPMSGFEGMIFRVLGDAGNDEDDYYVEYTGKTATGLWEECVKPDCPVKLDPATMPHRLINTGLNQFTFGPAPWGDRVAGDEDSAPTPSFVGRKITEVAFDNARLLILTAATAVWSRTNNPYVYFPDTVQTKLATAPVDYEVKSSKKIAILSTVLQTDDTTFLWALNRQFKVSTGDQPFTADAVAIKPNTSYSYNALVDPVPVGRSVMFINDNGPYSTATDLEFAEGQPIGDTGLTDHVPKYVPRGVSWMDATDTGKKAFVFTPLTPNLLYIYEWHYSGDNRVQSAWHTWRLPADCRILWGTFDRAVFYLTVQRPDGVWLLDISCAPYQSDDVPGARYLTRLDMRIDESSVTRTVVGERTKFTLPYLVPDTDNFAIVTRQTIGGRTRGDRLVVTEWGVEAGKTVAWVSGNLSSIKFYAGWLISSERLEGTFFDRNEEGQYRHADSVTVAGLTYVHSDTAYYRLEVLDRDKSPTQFQMTMTGRYSGDPENIFGEPILKDGNLHLPVAMANDEIYVRAINDTFLPSAWQSAVWHYETKRAR